MTSSWLTVFQTFQQSKQISLSASSSAGRTANFSRSFIPPIRVAGSIVLGATGLTVLLSCDIKVTNQSDIRNRNARPGGTGHTARVSSPLRFLVFLVSFLGQADEVLLHRLDRTLVSRRAKASQSLTISNGYEYLVELKSAGK